MKKQFLVFLFFAIASYGQERVVIINTVDDRDGKKYKTVKIGNQTWTAENLNYDVKGSVCYKNKPANCKKYGRLYDWEAAMKACPKGWHLPSNDEWNVLMKYVNPSCSDNNDKCEGAGTKLKAKDGWNKGGNGEDTYGFSALPGGCGDSYGDFGYTGKNGYWWSASEGYSDFAFSWSMGDVIDFAYWYYLDKYVFFSVRCLQD